MAGRAALGTYLELSAREPSVVNGSGHIQQAGAGIAASASHLTTTTAPFICYWSLVIALSYWLLAIE
jgi:hypothetical protein